MSRWIQTYTGKRFDLEPVLAASIDIVDIAHALSLLCRFGGHCREFYSVAQHSVYVSRIVSPKHALHGLLHDAAEAYVQDLVHDVKQVVGSSYKLLESRVELAIGERFGIVWDAISEEDVHIADMTMLATEKRDLMVPFPWDYPLPPAIESWGIDPLDPRDAEEMFIKRFKELTNG